MSASSPMQRTAFSMFQNTSFILVERHAFCVAQARCAPRSTRRAAPLHHCCGTIWNVRPPGRVMIALVGEVNVIVIWPSLPFAVGARYAHEMHCPFWNFSSEPAKL